MSLFEGKASCCCFSRRISAPLKLWCKNPTTLFTLPSNFAAVFTWKDFCKASFNVRVKNTRWGVISSSVPGTVWHEKFPGLVPYQQGSNQHMLLSIKRLYFSLCVIHWIVLSVIHDSLTPSRERCGALWLSHRNWSHVMPRHWLLLPLTLQLTILV